MISLFPLFLFEKRINTNMVAKGTAKRRVGKVREERKLEVKTDNRREISTAAIIKEK